MSSIISEEEFPELSAHDFTRAHRAHCARIEPVRNAHGNKFGAQEMVHMRTNTPCTSDYPCWPLGMSSARIGTA